MGLILLFIISSTHLQTSFNRVSFEKLYRVSQTDLAVKHLNDNLWFGYGLGVYDGNIEGSKRLEEYAEWHMASHNGYLAILLQYLSLIHI